MQKDQKPTRDAVPQPPQEGYPTKLGKVLLLEMSFPRRRESSLSWVFWTPACAGVTIEMLKRLPV